MSCISVFFPIPLLHKYKPKLSLGDGLTLHYTVFVSHNRSLSQNDGGDKDVTPEKKHKVDSQVEEMDRSKTSID